MGTIKLEIDLPEFDKELSINVTICKDGEVYYTTSSPSTSNSGSNNVNKVKEHNNTSTSSSLNTSIKEDEKPLKKSSRGGNMMNLIEI